MVKTFFVYSPLLINPIQVSNLCGVGGGPQIYKSGLELGMTIGGDSE